MSALLYVLGIVAVAIMLLYGWVAYVIWSGRRYLDRAAREWEDDYRD
jgi:hypothetical protein